MGYSNRTWSCPFFTWDERLCVHCEGGCVTFPDREAEQDYIRQYCASRDAVGWKACSVAGNLLKYYERTD